MNQFPEDSDIITSIPEPFGVNRSGEWVAIGIGTLGLVVRHRDDPTIVRWVVQVLKFAPQDDYLERATVDSLLLERGITGVEWWSPAEI